MPFVINLCFMCFYFYGVFLVNTGQVHIADFMAVFMAIGVVNNNLMVMMYSYPTLTKSKLAARDVFGVLDYEIKIDSTKKACS